MMTIKNYVRAQSLQEAYDLNLNKRNRIIGGMLWLKMSNAAVNTAIDISGLGLDTIEETEDGFSIGAMVSLRQMELHPGLNACTGGAIRNAVKDIVGVQFRNIATVGGSIWGRFGFSDVLTVFLALETRVELFQAGIVSLEEFASMKRDRDLLVRIIVKKPAGTCAYLSMRNARTDFPVIACAACMVDDGIRLAVGARPGRAKLLRDPEGKLSAGLNPESAAAYAQWAQENVSTGSNIRGSAEYRSHLVRVLTERALLEMGGNEHGN